MKIIPSILAAKLSNLANQIKQKKITYVHFDVMDGHFVPEISFGSFLAREFEIELPEVKLDVHLMVTNTQDQIPFFLGLKNVSRILIHFEGNFHHLRLLRQIRNGGKQAGIAINPETNPESIQSILDYVDAVCVMSVTPGYSGQSFIPGTKSKIKKLAEYRTTFGFRYSIIVDGGITNQLIGDLSKIGADEFIMGSQFFND